MTITTSTDRPTCRMTTLEMIANGAASPAYLDVDATLWRARRMLGFSDGITALATRLGAHAEQQFRDHVREHPTMLPSGLNVNLSTWDSDYARLTYCLLLTYRQQAEQRCAELARASNPGMR